MKKHPPPNAIFRARALRRDPTDAEQVMWRLLQDHFGAYRFRRQVPLLHYIADFASHRARLVIELDGGQHGGKADRARDAAVAGEGYRTLRFWNNEVLGNAQGVMSVIATALAEQPAPWGGR